MSPPGPMSMILLHDALFVSSSKRLFHMCLLYICIYINPKALLILNVRVIFHLFSSSFSSKHLAINKTAGFTCLFVIAVFLGRPAWSRRRLSQAAGQIFRRRNQTGLPRRNAKPDQDY